MADIDIRRNHDMGLKAAHAAAEKMAEHLGEKFGLRGKWDGNLLHFDRPGVAGTLAISGHDIALSVSLGFLLKAMKGSIETAIIRELDQLFAVKPKAAAAPQAKPPAKSKKAAERPKKGG